MTPELPMPCPEDGCGGTLRRRRWKGAIWYRCDRRRCRAKLRCHDDGRPMGTPGDAQTRALRAEAHRTFDRLWVAGRMGRDAAYLWASHRLGLPRVHIGELDADGCRALLAIVEPVAAVIPVSGRERERIADESAGIRRASRAA